MSRPSGPNDLPTRPGFLDITDRWQSPFGVHHLQQDFNQSSDTLRVLTVLSPICPYYFEGYEMMLRMP